MAQVNRLYPDTYEQVWDGTGGIAAGAYLLSNEIDNAAGLWQGMYVYVRLDFFIAPADSWLHVAIIEAVDGTNYEDAVTTTYQQKVVASIRYTSDTAQKHGFHVPRIPPCKFKLRFHNSDAVRTVLGTSEAGILLYTTELAAS